MPVKDSVFIDIIAETKKSVANIATMAAGVGAALLVFNQLKKGIEGAIEAAKLASELKQISRAFENMAYAVGQDADDIMASLKEMSAGTISELDLMRSASKASLLGLPIEDLDDLMKIARASSTATGASVEKMFDDIVTGIARGSPLILDNLGLTIKSSEAYKKYAKAIGKTVEELTAQESMMAIHNATLEAGADILEKVGDAATDLTDLERWQQMTAASADLKTELGNLAMYGFKPIIGFLNSMMRGLAETLKNLRYERDITLELISANQQLADMFGDRARSTDTYMNAAKELAALGLTSTREQIVAYGKAKLLLVDNNDAMAEALRLQQDLEESKISELDRVQTIVNFLGEYLGLMEAAGVEAEGIEATFQAIAEIRDKIKLDLAPKDEGGRTIQAQMADELDRQIALYEIGEKYRKKQVKHEEHMLVLLKEQNDVEDDINDTTLQWGNVLATAAGSATSLVKTLVEGGEGGEAMMRMVQTVVSAAMMTLSAIAAAESVVNPLRLPHAVAWAAAAATISALGEGGIVTKPTMALIGEAGPEAVIPLDRAGIGGGGTTVIINAGSIISERGLKNRVMGWMARGGRGR